MTNAYVRVQRGGKYQNVEIEYLSDEERQKLFKEASNEEVLKWLNFMCNQYEHLVLAMINKFGGSDEILFDGENKEERK